IFQSVTREVGVQARCFIWTPTADSDISKLPKEWNRRVQREVKKSLRGKPQASASPVSPKKTKSLNLSTYKWHAMGDYVDTITTVGTVGSYSVQIASNIHFLILVTS
ncbi:hypothetical protein GGX14DRAFT_366603, partial [Mycena pura]